MTKLSVNINKIALIRNSRNNNLPDVIRFAQDCERFGAQGITVHPRPDQRHIRRSDVYTLKPLIKTEFNIEGNPTAEFVELVLNVRPDQVTLVPDAPEALTSNSGWDTLRHQNFLKEVIRQFKNNGIRVSIFVNPVPEFIEGAARAGADRVELYTEPYAEAFPADPEIAIASFIIAAEVAAKNGLGLNAGHDLNLKNLRYFRENIPGLLEVSIGHALVADALYYGIENTIGLYLNCLR